MVENDPVTFSFRVQGQISLILMTWELSTVRVNMILFESTGTNIILKLDENGRYIEKV